MALSKGSAKQMEVQFSNLPNMEQDNHQITGLTVLVFCQLIWKKMEQRSIIAVVLNVEKWGNSFWSSSSENLYTYQQSHRVQSVNLGFNFANFEGSFRIWTWLNPELRQCNHQFPFETAPSSSATWPPLPLLDEDLASSSTFQRYHEAP